MPYFPFFIDIEGRDFLVVGGGRVALRKIEKLLPFKPEITVVSPEICGEIKILGVHIKQRPFADGDIEGRFCVISATDSEAVNAHIFALCSERKILINTVDDKEKCSFVFPALSGGGNVTVGISTGGKSPAYASFLRESVDGILDGRTLETAEIMGRYRPLIKRMFDGEDTRKKVNDALLKLCTEGDSLPDENEINDMLGSLRKSYENKNRNEKI